MKQCENVECENETPDLIPTLTAQGTFWLCPVCYEAGQIVMGQRPRNNGPAPIPASA